jgi:hypothetical protein
MQIIPFKEPAAWQVQITLTGTIYILYFRWNAMNKYWVMNIYNLNSEPIVLGIKIVTNYNLTQQFVATGMPSGDILCQNILNQWNEIQRFDMGETNELIYYEAGEIQANIA